VPLQGRHKNRVPHNHQAPTGYPKGFGILMMEWDLPNQNKDLFLGGRDGDCDSEYAALKHRLACALLSLSPTQFEIVTLKILSRVLSFNGDLYSYWHCGGPNDGGIDGILYSGNLHQVTIPVQAKKYSPAVGPSIVREFSGTIATFPSNLGIIITTSTFSSNAILAMLRSSKRIILLDIQNLCDLMIRFGIGIFSWGYIPQYDIDERFLFEVSDIL
jgi:restriction endonuclease Mrr